MESSHLILEVEYIGKYYLKSKLMKTYILFIFGMFEDQEDVDYFCTQVMGDIPILKSLRFIVEKEQNIIAIFESDIEEEKLTQELYLLLVNDNVKFYFMFDRDTMVTNFLPREVRNFIFNPHIENIIIKIDYPKYNKTLDLDQVLDKIKETGVDSLTPEEKNFLDNFEN